MREVRAMRVHARGKRDVTDTACMQLTLQDGKDFIYGCKSCF